MAARRADVTNGTVRVKIRTGPRLESLAGIVRISLFRQFSRRLGKGLGEKHRGSQRAQLVGLHPSVILHLVHLRFRQTEDEIGCATVTGAAFGPARKSPGLFS